MNDHCFGALKFVREYLHEPAQTGIVLEAAIVDYLAQRFAFHLNCLAMQQERLNRPHLIKRMVDQMTRHVLPGGKTVHAARLRSLQAYVDALSAFPKMLEEHPSVSSIVRAWQNQLKGLLDQITAIPQPHRPILWETADAHHRLTELIHPAHLAYQGVHQRNCLINAPLLMKHRHEITDQLASWIPLWPNVEAKTARVISLDTVRGPQATIHISNGTLIDAEAPKGALLNPTMPCWDAVIEAMIYLAAADILDAVDPLSFRTQAVTHTLIPKCSQLALKVSLMPSHITTWRGRVVIPYGGRG